VTEEQQELMAEAIERERVAMDVRKLQENAALGRAIVQFISSPIGDALVARAELDERGVLENLATADPEDTKAIRNLQTDLVRIRTWQHWLQELVAEGKGAEETLSTYQ